MKKFSIINIYIFKELLLPFTISLFFLTFVFLMTRIPQITNMIVNYNADINAIVLMMIYTLPKFLGFTIPMSVMISILLTFIRLSSDNELTAIKNAGVSLYKLLLPVMVFCFLSFVLSMWVMIVAFPWGRTSLKKQFVEIAQSSIDMALQERQFNLELENLMIYVSHVDMKTKKLTNVFIEDRRTKDSISICAAPYGNLVKLEDELFYTISLENGVINQVDIETGSVNNISFGNYDINIDIADLNKNNISVSKGMDEKSLIELLSFVKSEKNSKNKFMINSALIKIHEKFSIPFACIALGLLAFAIGGQPAIVQKYSSLGLGLFFFLIYYFLLAAGWSAGETGNYHPAIGMWLPNFVMMIIGIFLLDRNAKEKQIMFFDLFKNLFLKKA